MDRLLELAQLLRGCLDLLLQMQLGACSHFTCQLLGSVPAAATFETLRHSLNNVCAVRDRWIPAGCGRKLALLGDGLLHLALTYAVRCVAQLCVRSRCDGCIWTFGGLERSCQALCMKAQRGDLQRQDLVTVCDAEGSAIRAAVCPRILLFGRYGAALRRQLWLVSLDAAWWLCCCFCGPADVYVRAARCLIHTVRYVMLRCDRTCGPQV